MTEEVEEEDGSYGIFTNEVVMRRLFPLLDVPTLKTCRLLNSYWKDLSSPTFFRKTVLDIHQILVNKGQGRHSTCSKEVLNFITNREFHHPHVILDYPFMLELKGEGTIKEVLKGVKRLEFHGIEKYAYGDERGEFYPHVARILKHVGSQLEGLTVIQWGYRMRDLDCNIFPEEGINFPGLRALNLSFPCFHEYSISPFLSRIFTQVPNLEELSIAVQGWVLERVLDTVDFSGVNKKISKLSWDMNLNLNGFRVVDFIRQNFVGLRSLTLKHFGVYMNNPSDLGSFANMSTSLSSMLTLNSLELHLEYFGLQYVPLFTLFPSFPNLEELILRVEWSRKGGKPDGKIFHWATTLDEIDYVKSFPKLKKLSLHMDIERCALNLGSIVSTAGETMIAGGVSVCPTLRQVIITCPESEKFPTNIMLTDGVRKKLCHKFPNAKIFFMGKFVDTTTLLK